MPLWCVPVACLLKRWTEKGLSKNHNELYVQMATMRAHICLFKKLSLQAWCEQWLCRRIHIAHLINGRCTQNVVDANDILMLEAQQNLDLAQCALAVGLVLKGADLFDGSPDLVHMVISRATRKERWR